MADKKIEAVKKEEAAPAKKTAAKKTAAKKTATKAAATPPAAKKTVQTATPAHAEIAQLAYRFWSERGRPHGDDQKDWLHAEQELKKGK